jgi:hypothetical protein
MNDTGDMPQYTFEQLIETGVLWAINAHLFHPLGFALAVDLDDDGKATGWSLLGDGSQPWFFADDAATHEMTVDRFRRFTAFIKGSGA